MWLFVVFVLFVCEFLVQFGDRLVIIMNVDVVRVGVSEVFLQGDCEIIFYFSDNYFKCIFDFQFVLNMMQDVSDLIKLYMNFSNSCIKICVICWGFYSFVGFVCFG